MNGGDNRQYFITRAKAEDEEGEYKYDVHNLWVGSSIDVYDEIVFHTADQTLEDFGFDKQEDPTATERDYFSTLLSDISYKIKDEFYESKFIDDFDEAICKIEKEMDVDEPFFSSDELKEDF